MLLPKLIRLAPLLVLTLGALIATGLWAESMNRDRPIVVVLRRAPWVFPLICLGAFMLAAHLDKKSTQHLLAVGVVAPAVVQEVRDSGIELGVSPVFTVLVRVAPPGAEPFESEVSLVPPRQEMGVVRQGTHLTVRYDPTDHRRIAVETIMMETHP